MSSSANNNRVDPTNTSGGGGGIDSLQQSIISNWGGLGNSSRFCAVIVSPPGGDSAQASE